MVTAVVGANWGDEGKGKVVDVLASQADVVIRFQGGANAGHTIKNKYGKFALHTLPSGVCHPEVMNIIGNGVALSVDKVVNELKDIESKGVPAPKLMISDRCQIVMSYHVLFDSLEEARLAGKSFGSTKSGIAPFYSDKFAKIGIQVSELEDMDALREKVEGIVLKKNIELKYLYHTDELKVDDIITSSSTLAGYGAVGAGIPPYDINRVVVVSKAYSSAVGAGEFVSEIFGDEAEKLRKRGGDGGEYGATTGRPRRVGFYDTVASRYGVRLQGGTEVALTVLDCLSYLDEIPVCVGYELDGKVIKDFPTTTRLKRCKPVWTKLPGWKTDIRGIRKYEDLPENARKYVEFIEKELGVHISMVSNGPAREDIIYR